MSISLDSHPKNSELHLWVDYAELLCLFNEDGILSKADFEDQIEDGEDLGETKYIENKLYASTPEFRDEFSQKTDDIFRHMKHRHEAFDAFYPFYVDPLGQLQFKKPTSDQQRFYLYLLFASNLNRLRIPGSTDRITNEFEDICAEAMRRMLPTGAEVHIFGPRHGGRYSGSIWDKVNTLASDLKEIVIAPESDFSPRSTGDKGLDIVAWSHPGDENSGRILLFSQCACSAEQWKIKQRTSAYDSWRHRMTFKSRPINITFIPYQFRRADGSWYVNNDIEAMLVDRQRLVHLLKGDLAKISSFSGLDYVNEVLSNFQPQV